MFADDDPFWFVSSELLARVFHAELGVVTQLLAKHPNLPNLFDAPEGTVQERAACFALLAHFKVFETADEKFTARYEESPSLDDVESNTLKRIHSLVPADAPAWVQEMQQVVEQLPSHIYASLPEPLRLGGYNPDNAEQMQAIESAKTTLSSVEQIQALTERVIDQQLQRLVRRWPTGTAKIQGPESSELKKRKGPRTRDLMRTRRDKLIAEIDDISPTIVEFLQLMDERKVAPQPTWSGWPGSWREAYKDLRLRKLIHQDMEKPPISIDLEWADSQRNEEIIWLERLLKPTRPNAEAGRKIWRDLLRAITYADVRKACGRWSQLPPVRGAGLTPFPDHVRTNAAQFLAMKRNKRFPKSSYGDDSRIEYLARGMAGIMVGRSPMTGIERLRNMKHSPGGPFWTEREGNQPLPRDRQYCSCWGCRISRGNKLTKTMQTAYDDGFRVFMQIAAETRAPKEWKNRLLRWFSREA
jgi:hypothetical protein